MAVVVLDTNILISAIVFGGKPRTILELALRGKIQLAISEDILDELQVVLHGKKFKYPLPVCQEIVHELISLNGLTIPQQKINVIKNDPSDNKILECALSARAGAIVSGDVDLLSVGKFQEIPIYSPDDFLKKYKV